MKNEIIYKYQVIKALNDTANKYLHPYKQVFFTIQDCPVCVLFKDNCNICPLNIDYSFGCVARLNFTKLKNEMAEYMKLPSDKFLVDNPTPAMIERGKQLRACGRAIKAMPYKTFAKKDFKTVYKYVI